MADDSTLKPKLMILDLKRQLLATWCNYAVFGRYAMVGDVVMWWCGENSWWKGNWHEAIFWSFVGFGGLSEKLHDASHLDQRIHLMSASDSNAQTFARPVRIGEFWFAPWINLYRSWWDVNPILFVGCMWCHSFWALQTENQSRKVNLHWEFFGWSHDIHGEISESDTSKRSLPPPGHHLKKDRTVEGGNFLRIMWVAALQIVYPNTPHFKPRCLKTG